MLSDAEQHRLTEIETQLQSDDPVFVQRFDDRTRQGRPSGWHRLAMIFCFTFAVMICGAGLAWSNVAVVVIAVSAIGATGMLWSTHRLRSCPPSAEGRSMR